MGERIEKLIFSCLGALTAVIVGLALFGSPDEGTNRNPASKPNAAKPDPLYFYFFD